MGWRCAASRVRSSVRQDTRKTSLAWSCNYSSRLLSNRCGQTPLRRGTLRLVRRHEQRFQAGPAPNQPRLHRPQVNALNFRNFFVNKALDVPQNQRGPIGLGNLAQRGFNPGPFSACTAIS